LLHEQSMTVFFEVLKSKNSYKIIVPFFFVIGITGFFAPRYLEFLAFKDDAPYRILGNLLTGFIAIPSTVLAIAAILFAILQISNRKITIIQLVFQNSFIIPVIYWAILNILFLFIIQLLIDGLTPYLSIRLVVISSYNLILLLFGLLITLYRCFRYLDYTNITDDYIANIYSSLAKELRPATKEFDTQQLRQKGKEANAEVTDAINKDDVIIANKYLKSFAYALNLNPSSNYITDFNKNLAGWIIRCRRLKSRLFGPFIEFWRSQLTIKVENPLKFNFNNIDRIPLLAYQLTENDENVKNNIIEAFSLRLKEIAQKKYYLSLENEVLRLDSNFDGLITVYMEYSELIKYLVSRGDYYSLRIVLNDIRMLRETFKNGEYDRIRRNILENRLQGRNENSGFDDTVYERYEVRQKATRQIEMIVLGNLYWIYFQLFNQKLTIINDPKLIDIINLFEIQFRFDELIETIVYLFSQEDNRLKWEDWIWQGEERLSGKAYALPGIVDLIASGFAISMMKNGGINIGKHSVSNIDQLKFLLTRSRDFLKLVLQAPQNWNKILNIEETDVPNIVKKIFEVMDRIDNQIQDDQTEKLARAPISHEKIQAFKELMQQQWETSRDLSRAFEYFKAIEIDSEDKLVDLGYNVNFNKAKIMFVDGELYSPIYGIEFGNEVNRLIEARFANKVKPLATTNVEPGLVDIFEKGILDLKENKFTPNAIFVDMGLFYANEIGLSATGKYTSMVNHNNPYNFQIAGFFNNDIPIIIVKDYGFQGLIVVTEMPKGIIMQQRQDDSYYGKSLIVEVDEITEEKATQMIQERQEQGNPENLTLLELMASVIIHVHQICDFKIIDAAAVKVYKSNRNNFGD
jgi:hypothetical protein